MLGIQIIYWELLQLGSVLQPPKPTVILDDTRERRPDARSNRAHSQARVGCVFRDLPCSQARRATEGTQTATGTVRRAG